MVGIHDLIDDGRVRNYVGGTWESIEGPVGEDVVDSATGNSVAAVPFSAESSVDEAIGEAHAAFEEWRSTPVEERIQPLFELKQLLEDHHQEMAEVLVKEHGKTLDEAKGELRRGIENVEVATGIPSLMQAGHLPNAAPDIDETAVRRPLGVFAAITPFNFPGMIPLWFLPYAVATGNTFVLKPSEKTPLTAAYLFELLDEAGFPPGVVNLVNGGPDTVNTLLTHEDVEGVSFVGSTPVAKHVYETAASHGKRVQAQGGANNHIAVSPSADLSFAAEQTVGSAFANSGQRCLANPNAVVPEAIYGEFADMVVSEARDLTVASGLQEDTTMGPLISEDHLETVEAYIETGVEEGATLLLDGRTQDFPDQPAGGYFIGPTVFGDVTPDMTIAKEEIFGPVLSLLPVTDLDEAIQTINADPYGNAASLFTDRGADARKFRHNVEAGNVGVNIGTAAPMAFFHFGGMGESFFGDLHAQDEDVVRFYTDEVVYIERWPEA